MTEDFEKFPTEESRQEGQELAENFDEVDQNKKILAIREAISSIGLNSSASDIREALDKLKKEVGDSRLIRVIEYHLTREEDHSGLDIDMIEGLPEEVGDDVQRLRDVFRNILCKGKDKTDPGIE